MEMQAANLYRARRIATGEPGLIAEFFKIVWPDFSQCLIHRSSLLWLACVDSHSANLQMSILRTSKAATIVSTITKIHATICFNATSHDVRIGNRRLFRTQRPTKAATISRKPRQIPSPSSSRLIACTITSTPIITTPKMHTADMHCMNMTEPLPPKKEPARGQTPLVKSYVASRTFLVGGVQSCSCSAYRQYAS